MACPEVAGVDPRLVLYDRRHADVYAEWLELLGDADAAEDAAQWALLSAAEGVEEDEVSRLVHAALPDLPVAARTALLLREREGLTYAEVAERIGVTQPTAERVVYVARIRLVEALRRIRQALNLAPLLGWLKSTAAGLTAAKGVAAVATLGAAAGLSALALPVGPSEPAGRPGQTLKTRSPQSASVVPSAEARTRSSRPAIVRSDTRPSRTSAAAVTPSNTASLGARVVPPSQVSATPASKPASDNLSLAPIGPPEPVDVSVVSPIAVPTPPAVPTAPAVPLPPALPAPPVVEVPVVPALVEVPVVPVPVDVASPVPNAGLPPLPLPGP